MAAPLTFSFFLILILTTTLLNLFAYAQTPPPTSPPTPFKPTITVLLASLTAIFSLTFLLLLYIKHCNARGNSTSPPLPSFSARKNSGIDRCVVESLPIFRFGSLVGQKEGLDCAVCLAKFEAAELLRLLPKCKHAFHVECVDTWLDAHSTCPLCRYRVDPEDILLVENVKVRNQRECVDLERGRTSWWQNQEIIAESKRRHSSVGERGNESERRKTASFRISLDSATWRKKNESAGGIGCLARARKDGMLLTDERKIAERRVEHRIIVSPSPVISNGGTVQSLPHQRWSDVHASDLLYLTSEMILMREGERGKYTRGGVRKKKKEEGGGCNDDEEVVGRVINSRSVSEITGLSRNVKKENKSRDKWEDDEEGLVSRWLAWISKSHTQHTVR